MPLIKNIHTVFFWMCDKCGQSSPEACDGAKATQIARNMNWHIHVLWQGAYSTLCENCFDEAEEEAKHEM